MNRLARWGFALGTAMLACCFVLAPPGHASDGNQNPTLYPPDANVYGASFGEWTAAWWRWAFSLTIDNHPLFDNAGCDVGQTGPVWFLGGAFTGTATVRECTVPAGKAILLPVLNAECSNVEPPPFYGGDEAELRACAQSFMDTAADMFASIDGRDVQNLGGYRVQSPLYTFDAPDGGLLGGLVTGALSVSDGVWLFLAPLSAGSHTLHFGGSFPGFLLDVTYHLTVLPGGRGHARVQGDPEGVTRESWGVVKDLYKP